MTATQRDGQVVTNIGDIEQIERVPLAERNLPKTTYEAIRQVAERQPDRLAIRYIENGDQWREARDSGQADLSFDITFADLMVGIHRTANLFRSLGVGDKDVISMVLPNVPAAHFTLWGGEAAGVVNPINHMLEAAVIGEIAESAKSKVLVLMGVHREIDTAEKLAEIRVHAPSVEHILVVGQLPEGAEGCLGFEKAIQKQRGDALDFDREITPDTVASLFHTGGTTGLPKLAQHSHFNEVYTAWAINCSSSSQESDCYLTGLPLFHCNAAIGTGLKVFMTGGTVLLAGINGYRSPGIVTNMYQLIDHYKVTHFSAVPTIYSVLAQLPVGECDLSSVRFAVCGAAPMPVELFHTFQQITGIRIVEGYGLTEATVCSTLTPPGCEIPRIGSIGIRLPYTRVKTAVIDGEGHYIRDCGVDEVGTVIISGPSVTPGYTDASKNAELYVTDANGVKWLNTGDLARQDADGYFWLTGRAKELIIRGGHNIDPKTIEEALAAHPAVNLAAAVGRPDSYAGEVPVAYVDTVAETSEAELLEYCRQVIGERAAIPKAITILQQLPVTGVGKIHKPTLHLRELKIVVEQTLAGLVEHIASYSVNPEVDPRRGNTARISITGAEGVRSCELDATVRQALSTYSFPFSLEIV